jgi:hypothetical protein
MKHSETPPANQTAVALSTDVETRKWELLRKQAYRHWHAPVFDRDPHTVTPIYEAGFDAGWQNVQLRSPDAEPRLLHFQHYKFASKWWNLATPR